MSVRQSPEVSTNLTWVKSSYSGGEGGQCVEVADLPGAVHVRDSKDTARPMLTFGPDGWSAFVEFTAQS